MVMRSLASPIALRQVGGPAKWQNTLECAEQPPELVALTPPWNLERREAAAHLCVGFQGEQRVRSSHHHDTEFQVVGQVLQQIQ